MENIKKFLATDYNCDSDSGFGYGNDDCYGGGDGYGDRNGYGDGDGDGNGYDNGYGYGYGSSPLEYAGG